MLNRRESLLGDIAGLVQIQSEIPRLGARLVQWHRESEERFLNLLMRAEKLAWPLPLKGNFYQLSYLISTADKEPLDPGSLIPILEEVNNEVRGTVRTGWSMFYPFSRSEIAPAFHPENADGSGNDVLEANLLGDGDFDTSLPDFWRVTTDGRATLFRAYREDRERSSRNLTRPPGTWLSPETVVRETAEVVTHARLMSRRFETASKVSFRCGWNGLQGRHFADFDPGIHWRESRIARANHRTVDGEWSIGQLAAAWPTVVAELGCPVLRLFGFTECGPAFVEGMIPRFIKL